MPYPALIRHIKEEEMLIGKNNQYYKRRWINRHNTRKFHAKNVDPERTQFNIQFCNPDIRQAYHTLFDEAVKRYDEKQTRRDRLIE